MGGGGKKKCNTHFSVEIKLDRQQLAVLCDQGSVAELQVTLKCHKTQRLFLLYSLNTQRNSYALKKEEKTPKKAISFTAHHQATVISWHTNKKNSDKKNSNKKNAKSNDTLQWIIPIRKVNRKTSKKQHFEERESGHGMDSTAGLRRVGNVFGMIFSAWIVEMIFYFD